MFKIQSYTTIVFIASMTDEHSTVVKLIAFNEVYGRSHPVWRSEILQYAPSAPWASSCAGGKAGRSFHHDATDDVSSRLVSESTRYEEVVFNANNIGITNCDTALPLNISCLTGR